MPDGGFANFDFGNDIHHFRPRNEIIRDTGNTAPNDTKENDITLLLEIVDQFCKKIQRALKKRFFTVQFRVYEEELLSAHIVLKNYSFF